MTLPTDVISGQSGHIAHTNEIHKLLVGDPWYNVKGYGASGNGVDNDTTEIQAAIDAAETAGGIVYLPPGSYSVTTALLPAASNVTIKGAGPDLTTLVLGGSPTGGDADGIRVTKAAPYYSHIAIEDLTIDGSARTAGNGMTLQGVDFLRVERVKIIDPFGYGITHGTIGGTGTKINSPLLRDCIVTGERNGNDSFGGGGAKNAHYDNLRAFDPAGSGFDMTNLEKSLIRNVVVINTLTPVAGNWGVSGDFGWSDVTVEDCFTFGMFYGYFLASTSAGAVENVRFIRCNAKQTQRHALWLQGLEGFAINGYEISGCDFRDYNRDNITAAGILIHEAQRGLMHHNVIVDPAFAAYSIRLGRDGAGTGSTTTKILTNELDATNPIWFEFADATVVARDNEGFNPQGAAAITVTASPFTYTNTDHVSEAVYIRGGTVSNISKNSRTIFTTTEQTVWLEPSESVVVTYSVAPTMEKDRK